MVENVEYIVASTKDTRRLDVYTTDTPQLIPLFALNQDGSVSDKPCIALDNRVPTIAQSKGQNDVIVRDAKTGKLYLQSTEQSRFLTYGCDASTPGDVVVQDHTGARKAYGDRDALHNEKVSLYSVVHDEQTFAHLSLPRLILLVSIKRAEDMEELIQDSMDNLTESNAKLDALAQISKLCVNSSSSTINTSTNITYLNQTITIAKFLQDTMKETNVPASINKDELYDKVKNWEDDLNNVSQETMINLQKLISKRDQAYLLGSVSNKLVLNGNVMIARNL